MLFLAIGLAAGILAGLFGIGGGVLIVPALIYFAHQTPHRATGTSLAALLLPVGALGAWEYYKHGDLDLVAAGWIAAGLFIGAWLGAHWGSELPTRSLQRAFAVFLTLVAVHLWTTA